MLCYFHMESDQNVLEQIKSLVRAKKYRIRMHAVRHMIEEGFDETDLVEALAGDSCMLEDYVHEMHCRCSATLR